MKRARFRLALVAWAACQVALLAAGGGRVLAAAAGGLPHVRVPVTSAAPRIGPEAIWDAESEVSALHECRPGDTWEACVHHVMQQAGAPPRAVEFYDMTGWFLARFVAVGPAVDLGLLVNPWRANDNWQAAFLNGKPPVLMLEAAVAGLSKDRGDLGLRPDAVGRWPVAGAQALSEALAQVDGYSDPVIWPGHQLLEPFDRSAGAVVPPAGDPAASGGGRTAAPMRFVAQFDVVNTCHACGTGVRAGVAFFFDAGGAYQGASLLDLCRAPDARISLPVLEPCPGAANL